LARDLSALDAYLAALVMRLKYYRLPVTAASQAYIERLCDQAAVTNWVTKSVATAAFLDFEEPFRLSCDALGKI